MRLARVRIASAGLMLVVGSALGAQRRPDFSGTWVLVSPAGSAGQVETIKHNATTFTRAHASEGPGHAMTYNLDGSETRLVMPTHGDQIVILGKASWDGDRLVIVEAVTYPDGRKLSKRSVWSLDAQGQLAMEFTEEAEGKPAKTTRVVYRKKS